jgi:predicted RNA binding protein YcfA (HicA-like mRNA interferase family)
MASDERFSEIRKLLERHGWELKRINGSHHIFHGQGRPILSIPVHKNRVKAIYRRKIEQAIRSVEAEEENG